MATNRKEKRNEYNCSPEVIQKEVCDLRYEIGKSCKDCEYSDSCTYIRRKAWEIDQKRQVFEINRGVCPFRVTTKMDYVCFEGCEPVTTKISYEYPPCYEKGCPFFLKYIAGEGYKCTQVEGGIEDVSEGN